MNPYYNLPPGQRMTQHLVDQFNADERLWKKFEPRRRFRRKVLQRVLSRKQLKKLDLLTNGFGEVSDLAATAALERTAEDGERVANF